MSLTYVAVKEDKSLVESWVLADKFGLVNLRNEILKTIFAIAEKHHELPLHTHTLNHIYDNTNWENLLRSSW